MNDCPAPATPSAARPGCGTPLCDVCAEATTNSASMPTDASAHGGLHRTYFGHLNKASTPSSMSAFATATDPVGDRGLVAPKAGVVARSYLGAKRWPVANVKPSSRLISSCRISSTTRASRCGSPYGPTVARRRSRRGRLRRCAARRRRVVAPAPRLGAEVGLDRAQLAQRYPAGPAIWGAYWGGEPVGAVPGLEPARARVRGRRCYRVKLGWGRCRRGGRWVVWRPVSRVSKPCSNRPCWWAPQWGVVMVVRQGICSGGSAE
jgi:hypothetical protein